MNTTESTQSGRRRSSIQTRRITTCTWGTILTPGQPEWGCLGGFFATKSFQRADTIEIASWYKINPTPPIQSPEAVAEINQEYADMASALAGQTYYDNESLSGIYRSNYYTRTIANDVTQDTRRLTWRTKDYLLHDVANGVTSRSKAASPVLGTRRRRH